MTTVTTSPATATRTTPSAPAAIATLAGVTLARLRRGKALWIGALLAALPIPVAVILAIRNVPSNHGTAFFLIWQLLVALLSAMFVASSFGEEVETRTATYLWSRPIARWAVLAGKLVALTPIVIAVIVISWYASLRIWTGDGPEPSSCVALALAAVAACTTAAGIATLVPKYGMALTIGYLLVDNFFGALPFSLREITIAHQTSALAGLADDAAIATPVIALIAIAAVWGAIAALRIRRLEV